MLRSFCRVWLSCVSLLSAVPAWAQAPMVLPPSPIGDGIHDVFDHESGCWVWDGEARKAQGSPYPFTTSHKCDGKALDGDAELTWTHGPHRGESWKGVFHAGRLTGQSSSPYVEIGYANGLRNGPAIFRYGDGGRTELIYAAGHKDGPQRDFYSEGTRVEAAFTQDVPSSTWIRHLRDGSRFEFPGSLDAVGLRGTYFMPDGSALPGTYVVPRVNAALSPPVAYPPIAQRLEEEGDVTVTLKVEADGTVSDVRLARSSGYQRLDEAALEWFAACRYFPGTVEGKPVASYTFTQQSYRLLDPE